ncbi:MAG: carbohydrate kinase family protein [candidate division KSB1 bacterium]|nr:carbohydrate kinase family protein [candidate division KSB1 bacterium]MDZ7304512.1 carbohydrate kinase family protein [candidate division KSB1 bacterium]MDZ7313892.1 carbohydrate kinase family protein [candidate division KSB1 bacterium]
MPHREGCACAGNWIINHLHLIAHYPDEAGLAFIREESRSTGGCAYNVICNLRAIDPDLPLYAIGVVGEDEDGHSILDDCHKRDIDTFQLVASQHVPTAHMEVMFSQATGRRTFFYHPGGNGFLDVMHFDFDHCPAKWLHLGDLMLLEKLVQPDPEFGLRAGLVLHRAKAAGLTTSVNLITAESHADHRVVLPILPQVDYLVINEIEAERITGIKTRHAGKLLNEGVVAAAMKLLEAGVNEGIVIHFTEGAFAALKKGTSSWQGALKLPSEEICETTGADEAFCAGFLYGCYYDWPLQKCLQMSVCCAAANIRVAASHGGMAVGEANLELLQKHASRPL